MFCVYSIYRDTGTWKTTTNEAYNYSEVTRKTEADYDDIVIPRNNIRPSIAQSSQQTTGETL